ncbi:MAG TPA: class II aldolase/adducin family protein [Candidatus Dormibacteraeota bacterium]
MVGADGNLSLRHGEGMLVTPSRLAYDRTDPEDIVWVGADGRPQGRQPPSSEWALHAAVYAARPDVSAIVHAHPLYACVLAVRGEPLPALLEEVGPVLGGPVAIAEYAPSGTPDVGRVAVAALGTDRFGVILARHGTATVGADLETAFYRLEVLERAAAVYVLSGLRGRLTSST